ncbi:MAG: bifunctional phosphoglucose/phosphomannose isomerase [Candidatus Moranbacteria bacterium]|nr:bifunctional phosphoglucose/phosphomannose isomerase [Candidatus Moranbacteria bacterium]
MSATQNDPADFHGMVMSVPEQFADGVRLAKEVRFPEHEPLRSVVVSGMGGSALPVDALRIFLADLVGRGEIPEPVQIIVNRSYGLPAEARRSLNVFSSYSGNTEETIDAFEAALAEKLPSIGISSGGMLEEMCVREGIPHVKLPVPFPGFQPRLGTGYFLGALYQVFGNEGFVPDRGEEIAEGIRSLSDRLPDIEARGKALAEACEGKTPVVYASSRYAAVAMIWKIAFNENAKTTAFWNAFPELNHNEMVGFTRPAGPFQIVMLRDPEDHPRNRKRFEITAGILREQGVSVEILDMEGENVFNRVFSSLLLADFASYHLALRYGIDPTPVEMVERFKGML